MAPWNGPNYSRLFLWPEVLSISVLLCAVSGSSAGQVEKSHRPRTSENG